MSLNGLSGIRPYGLYFLSLAKFALAMENASTYQARAVQRI